MPHELVHASSARLDPPHFKLDAAGAPFINSLAVVAGRCDGVGDVDIAAITDALWGLAKLRPPEVSVACTRARLRPVIWPTPPSHSLALVLLCHR